MHRAQLVRARNHLAAATIHAPGQINFLFDPDVEPYLKRGETPRHFGVTKNTVGQKAKTTRQMLHMSFWDPEFSTQDMADTDPHMDMVMIDGFIVPISYLAPEVQEQIRRERGQ